MNLRRKDYYSEEDKGIAIQLKDVLSRAKVILLSNPDTNSVSDTTVYYWNIIRGLLEKLRLAGHIDKYEGDDMGFWVHIQDKAIRVKYNLEVIKYLFMKSKSNKDKVFDAINMLRTIHE